MKARTILTKLKTITNCDPKEMEKVQEIITDIEKDILASKKYQLNSLKKQLGEK